MLVSNFIPSVFLLLSSTGGGGDGRRGRGKGEKTLSTMQKPLQPRPQRLGLSKLTRYDN